MASHCLARAPSNVEGPGAPIFLDVGAWVVSSGSCMGSRNGVSGSLTEKITKRNESVLLRLSPVIFTSGDIIIA